MPLALRSAALLLLVALSACDADVPRSPLYDALAGRWEHRTPSGAHEVLVLGRNATFRLERDGQRIAEGELGMAYGSEALQDLRSLSYTIRFSRSYSEGSSDSVVSASATMLRVKGCIVLRECRGEVPGRVYVTERTYVRSAR